ncbi:MAG: Asp-tRNA(Asn)/Glu-tRNA(Gln) amidotransferase subunit GatB [Chloroflexi bacterium]|nr:Asp-tRNA(Asn)/Glu-tRNA(Gln) amidotransferase subunit GatB [Chloroflexota bacterium]
MTEYEAVIGLEVHSQLLTRSKMFCSCRADYVQAQPNTRVCPVCLGMPGVLPVINRQAVEFVIMTGLALHSQIAEYTKFDRKNYPYPDLMKGYQISQYDEPICRGGYLEIEVDGQRKRIGMTRVHLEEDVAKLQHLTDPVTSDTYSLVDVNRSGIPLMEIVGEPELRSPEEARLYLVKLRAILQYLGVSTGNMEEGSFRCDANVSVRPRGSTQLLGKVEVKNMNSFRAVYRALQYEVERQVRMVKEGQRVPQETRGWVEERGETVAQRSKEYAHDYRYFPEPDLPPMVISREWVERIRERLPELPEARRERFMAHYGLPAYDAGLLTASRATADFFEATVGKAPREDEALRRRAKAASNWVLGDLTHLLHLHSIELEAAQVRPQHLAELLDLLDQGTIGTPQAKTVLEDMFATGKPPSLVVAEKGLAQISNTADIEPVVAEAIEKNQQAVQDYLKGKDAAVKFLVGQVMKATRGKANPSLVQDLIQKRLEAMRSN